MEPPQTRASSERRMEEETNTAHKKSGATPGYGQRCFWRCSKSLKGVERESCFVLGNVGGGLLYCLRTVHLPALFQTNKRTNFRSTTKRPTETRPGRRAKTDAFSARVWFRSRYVLYEQRTCRYSCVVVCTMKHTCHSICFDLLQLL